MPVLAVAVHDRSCAAVVKRIALPVPKRPVANDMTLGWLEKPLPLSCCCARESFAPASASNPS